MKTTILFFVLSLFALTSCAQRTLIGSKSSNGGIITRNLDTLKSEWNKLLKNQNMTGEIVNFEIITQVDSASNNELHYILLGKNTDASIKMAALLIVDGKNLYLPGGGTTCSCTGCRIGCNPLYTNGQWICTPCQETGTCTKTVTVTTGN